MAFWLLSVLQISCQSLATARKLLTARHGIPISVQTSSALMMKNMSRPFLCPVRIFSDRKIAEAQFEAIRNLADEGDAVFIGRCADYVLRKRSDLVRVFITADLPSRIQALMEHGDVTEEQAKKIIKDEDKNRASYYRYYTDQTWGDANLYDLCLNEGRVGVDGAVQTIQSYLKALKYC